MQKRKYTLSSDYKTPKRPTNEASSHYKNEPK